MEIIALVLLVYFVIGAGVCLLVCVNPNDPGLLGKLSRLVHHKLPSAFGNLIKKVFGERVYGCFGSIKHYLMQTNHPLVQIFYLLIAVGGFILYQLKGIIPHMPSQNINIIHVYFANILAAVCFYIYYKACAVSPGQITSENEQYNVKKFKDYYDNILYTKDKKCRTCEVTKPARSKHCSVCGICVSKFDHHCIWIRQCVGEKNYKWFVMFLGFHALFCSYLAIIGTISMYDYIVQSKLLHGTFRVGNSLIKATPFLVFQYLFMTQTVFLFLIFMCAIMGFALSCFVLYHFYLISQGHTTNQRVKSNDFIAQLKDQIKFKEKIVRDFGGEDKLPEEFERGKGQTIKRELFLKYLQEDREELEILRKGNPKKGFMRNWRIIMEA